MTVALFLRDDGLITPKYVNRLALMAKYLRGHWSIEKQLHWMLDVIFKEDDSSVRMNHAPENLNILKR